MSKIIVKLVSFFSISLVILTPKINSQNSNNFKYQNPSIPSELINCILRLNDQELLLGADAGWLLKLNTQSNQIVSKKQIAQENIIKLVEANTDIMFILAYSNYLLDDFNSKIYKSIDGGDNWFEVYSGRTFLRDLVAVNSNNIIASALGGNILISNDSGVNWNLKNISEINADLIVIKKANSGIIYSAGGGRNLYRSDNLGETWESFAINGLPSKITDILLESDSTMFLTGDYGQVIKLNLNTKELVDLKPTYAAYKFDNLLMSDDELYCKATYDSYYSGYTTVLLKYSLNDSTWSKIKDYDFLINTLFIEQNNLYFFGDEGNFGFVDVQNDFVELINQNKLDDVIAISFVDEMEGWALTKSGQLLNTTNSGDNWNIQKELENSSLSSSDAYLNMQFISDKIGWISRVSNHYLIFYKTTDGGFSWEKLSDNYFGKFNSMFFLDENNGWIGRNPKSIFKSTNGGLNWINTGLADFNYNDEQAINDIQFLDENIGYAAGGYVSGLEPWGSPIYNIILLKTTDGGYNWEKILDKKSDKFLNSVSFTNFNQGFVSDASNIYITNDSGNTWYRKDINRLIISGSDFTDSNSGYVIGWQGGIFKSTDLGNSWRQQWQTTNSDINAIEIQNDSLIWFGGENGIIIRLGKPTANNFNEKNDFVHDYKLYQNYPNPFNPETTIEYNLPKYTNVKLEIYDILGRTIKVLVNEFQSEGKYTFQFNAEGFSSGIYFYQLTIGNMHLTKKMILLK